MRKYLIWSIALLLFFLLLGTFLVWSEREGTRFPFSFGLDLVGGTELVYRADTSRIEDVDSAMATLKEVIERRINIFGVSEPLVQTESAGLVSGNRDERLIVGLPGLTGRYLSRARVEFNPTTGAAVIGLEFNKDGGELFAQVTREHKGEILAILLDGAILSTPVIVDEISNGKAQITGSFTPEEAKNLVRNLNYGALPVPITLATSQTMGATLGEIALNSGVRAGVVGLIILSLFLIFWYRLPGLVSVMALSFYIILSLVIFKLIPVTLSAAGLAGFILSIGMAVDANVLI